VDPDRIPGRPDGGRRPGRERPVGARHRRRARPSAIAATALVTLAAVLTACGSSGSSSSTTGSPPTTVRSPDQLAYVTSVQGDPTAPGVGVLTTVDTAQGTVVHRTFIPDGPTDVVATPDGSLLLISQYLGDAVVPVEVSTGVALPGITTGEAPSALTVTPDGRTAVVANYGSGTVSVIDVHTLQVTSTITVGGAPRSAVVTADGRLAAVGDFGDRQGGPPGSTVRIVDLDTRSVVRTVDIGGQPCDMVLSGDGRTVYVTGYSGAGDTGSTDTGSTDPGSTDTGSTDTGARPADYGAHGFVVPIDIDTGALGTRTVIDGEPSGIALAHRGADAFVTVDGTTRTSPGFLVEVDLATHRVVRTAQTGTDPWKVAVTPDDATAWIADATSDDVVPVDLATFRVGTPVALPTHPHGVVLLPAGN